MIYDCIIIGAGASGVVAGINLKKRNKKVLVLEHKDRILKKVLVTGNGRCNYTNINATPKNYYSKENNFVEYLFQKYPPQKVIEFFRQIGIEPIEEANGKMYPRSFQASSVVDCLRNAIELYGLQIKTEYNIQKITKKEYFEVDEYKSKNLIIATGGNSYKELGSDGSGYEIAKKFGHSITELIPVLVQLKCDNKYIAGLEGIKQNVLLECRYNNKIIRQDYGEILFTLYGISGPTVFNQTPAIANYGFGVEFFVDFMPDISKSELYDNLIDRKNRLCHLQATDFLVGFLPKKLGMFLLKKSGIEKLNIPLYDIEDKYINNLVENIKKYRIIADDTMGFKNAQVTAGGVNTKEVDKYSYESKITKGLYFCGEILDVFGDCGGYNLQFAFASGLLLGETID